jgi:ribosomal-protein-alanine N-acetyltransferase
MREPIAGAGVDLLPLTEPMARDLLAGELTDPPAAPGWPHADTHSALLAALGTGDAEALPWLVVLQPDGLVVGDLGWKGRPDDDGVVEIGYGLAPAFRGRGIGGRAVQAFVHWLVDRVGVQRVLAEIHVDNVASRHLVERLGFELDHVDGSYAWYAYGAPAGRSVN